LNFNVYSVTLTTTHFECMHIVKCMSPYMQTYLCSELSNKSERVLFSIIINSSVILPHPILFYNQALKFLKNKKKKLDVYEYSNLP